MPQPWYRQFQKPKSTTPTASGLPSWLSYKEKQKPRGQGAALSPGAMVANAEAEAIRKRYSYYQTQKSEATLRDERLRKYFARYLGPGNIMEKGPMAALERTSEGVTNLALSANEAFKEAVIPGYQSPATKLRAPYNQVMPGGTGFWKPKRRSAQTAAATPNIEQAEQPAMLPSYLERFYAGLGPFGPPQPEETTPLSTGYGEGGGGYGGGYGYPYYGWGGGGGVNINFGGGRQQQQIARLPTTPRPDIQGWLQSLINWNIGG